MRDLPVVAVSRCLLGEHVRHDGGHRRRDHLLAACEGRVRWLPFCPEVEAGLGVPRPPVQLQEGAGGLRVVEVDGGAEHTPALRVAVRALVEGLRAAGVAGCVLKARSPSCGLRDVPRFDARGAPRGAGDGLAAAALRVAFPSLPIVTDEELSEPAALEAFLAGL